MEEEFQRLMRAATESQEKEATLFFIQKAEETIESDSKKEALEIAASFDKFRKESRESYNAPTFSGLFANLGDMIKRYHTP